MATFEHVTRIEDGLWQIDLGFQGRSGVIAAYLLAGEDDLALIETGPGSTLPALVDGIRAAGFAPEQLTTVLLTHIHLDHAGAAGALARLAPGLTVRVHPVGAPHLVDPSRLVASATRIYGANMDPLWGAIVPVAEARVAALADGETLSAGGRVLSALFTPGHASHHVAYWDAAAGAAYTGDVGGIRMTGTDYVCPPTPPPDLDPEAWRASAARLGALGARRLYLTHFGAFDDVPAHLAQLLPNLDELLAIGEATVTAETDQEALTARIHNRMAERLGQVAPDVLESLEWATPSYMAALGLTRYVTKKAERRGGEGARQG